MTVLRRFFCWLGFHSWVKGWSYKDGDMVVAKFRCIEFGCPGSVTVIDHMERPQIAAVDSGKVTVSGMEEGQ